jgi:hypothetical protein
VLYPDASVRNKVASFAVTALDLRRPGRVPRLMYQVIVGWEHTCSAAAAELKGIELAALYARSAGRHFFIMTDSQESITLINKRGRCSQDSRGSSCGAEGTRFLSGGEAGFRHTLDTRAQRYSGQ